MNFECLRERALRYIGENFTTERLPSTVIHYRGSSGRYYYFDACIIKRK